MLPECTIHVLNDYQSGSLFECVFLWHSSGPEFDPLLLAHSFIAQWLERRPSNAAVVRSSPAIIVPYGVNSTL